MRIQALAEAGSVISPQKLLVDGIEGRGSVIRDMPFE